MSIYIHTQRYGPKDKPPLVMLHGFAGTGHYWSPHFEKLVPYFHLIVPDLPGHGKSEISDGNYSFEEAANLLLDEILSIESRPLGLIGYSMGSRIGMYFLTRTAERFSRALFISGAIGIQDQTQREQRLKDDILLAQQIQEKGIEWFREYWCNLPIFASRKRDDILKHLETLWSEQNKDQLALALKIFSVGNQNYLLPQLQTNTIPIIYAAGELDEKYVELGKELSSQIPKFYLEVVNDCGHDIPSENPQWFQSSVIRFFIKK
ncbi:MAG: 2-succinyl-6-hydroxy-2,4-cyclohexadiene-1-carboxylate synthase [bacterium]|nr:2-succinyl-6-hydroxy-2,4-cyclohexadiene-1-carboxylate synthase [bacterium]